jgi:hypothetical protein
MHQEHKWVACQTHCLYLKQLSKVPIPQQFTHAFSTHPSKPFLGRHMFLLWVCAKFMHHNMTARLTFEYGEDSDIFPLAVTAAAKVTHLVLVMDALPWTVFFPVTLSVLLAW